jgi:DNA-binding transcriptional ArsR family regulator
MPRSPVASDPFHALSQGARRAVLDSLVAVERPVGEIVELVRISQPQVSKHLRVLGGAGLVSCRVEGRRHFFRVNHEGLAPLRGWLDTYERAWTERLDRVDDYLLDLLRLEGPT